MTKKEKTWRGCRHCHLARKYLLELLRLSVNVEDDENKGKFVEVPAFSEAGSYSTFGKDRARVIRGMLQKLGAALGIEDIDRIADQRSPSDYRAAAYELRDALHAADQAARDIHWKIRKIEDAEDFADMTMGSKNAIEQAFSLAKFADPAMTLRNVARALGIDENGRISPAWLSERPAKTDDDK